MAEARSQTGLLVWDGDASRRTGDELHSSGSVIHWDERQPPQGVAFTCHGCQRKRFTHATTVRYAKWSGLCRECFLEKSWRNKFPQDGKLPTGSIVHVNEPVLTGAGGRHVWVTCGMCGEKRIASVPTGKDRTIWTGLCVTCSGIYRRKRTKDETHATGTVIHWGERDPADPWNRVAITCHGCHSKRFTHVSSIKHKKWSGLCAECIERRGSHQKYTHDEPFEGGTIIHWGKPDPANPKKRVMVTCGECKQKRSITRVAASVLKSADGAWRCRQCHNASLRAHFASQRQVTDSGQQPKNGATADKRRRGPEKGSNAIITVDTVRNTLTRLGSHATQEQVAEALGVTDRAIREWQKAQNLKWRQVQQLFSKPEVVS